MRLTMVTRSAPTRGFRHSVAMYTLYSCIIPSVPPRANSMTLSPTAVNCNIIASKTNLLHILLTFFFFFFRLPPKMQSETQVQSVLLTNCVFFFLQTTPCAVKVRLATWASISKMYIDAYTLFFFCLPPSNCRRIKMTVPVIVQKKFNLDCFTVK